jgi:hypothetical protein
VTAQLVTIASVVEGHGEVPGLPALLHRIADDHTVRSLRTPPPFRRNKGTLVVPGGIEAAVQATAHRIGEAGGVLVLIDADDDRPGCRGPELLARARKARSDVPVSVVLANKEFEAWFLAGASSLAGHSGFPPDLAPPPQPESIRDAKGWLTAQRRRAGGQPYKPTVDQAPLARAFDMRQARAGARSFDKFWREVEFLLTARRAGSR